MTQKNSPLSRRRFLVQGSTFAAASAFAPTLQAYSLRRAAGGGAGEADGYGAPVPTIDQTTGLPLLKLPPGFRYSSHGWSGDVMSDGTMTPDRHDGMAVVSADDSGAVTMIRNHERGPTVPGQPVPVIGGGAAPTYDAFTLPGVVEGLGGGTTSMTFRGGQLIDDRATLAGTLTNCAGGRTPWRSWLTCEETIVIGSAIGAKDHGFVYEVPDPAVAPASAMAITDMGLMDHEAVAVDPRDSRVYLTEDNGPNSGFYRFTPNVRAKGIGAYEAGGVLEMLKVVGRDNADLAQAQQGNAFDVEWVRIADPTAMPESLSSPLPGFPPIEGQGRSGPYMQGEALGGAVFARGEGCWYANGKIYFIDTSGGAAGKGTVWIYDPRRMTLRALFVSPDEATADNPDNVTIGPRGGVLVCEDGGGIRDPYGAIATGARMLGITRAGRSYVFAENNMMIDNPLPGRPLIPVGDYRGSEWAGATFDPSGSYLYVNIQTPGVTFAITGPWSAGPL